MKVLHVHSGLIAATALAMAIAPAVSSAQSTAATGHQPLRMTSTYSTHAVGRLTAPRATRTAFGARGIAMSALTEVVQKYCGSCHSPTNRRGNLNLRGYVVDSAFENADVSEKMIRKLRAQMMPPPGSKRPTGDTLVALVETLERVMDESAPINPGTRTFQRLNRAEYERVVRDLLGLEVNAGDWLPLDTKSANFDNISDVQALSPTLLDGYLNAAASISRMAVGDRKAVSMQALYKTSPFDSQHPWDHVEGTPYGTRGGMAFVNNFPADGEYEFRLNVGGGVGRPIEDLDISIDGERVALLSYDRGIARNGESADFPAGADFITTEPIKVKAGQRKVSVAFLRKSRGTVRRPDQAA